MRACHVVCVVDSFCEISAFEVITTVTLGTIKRYTRKHWAVSAYHQHYFNMAFTLRSGKVIAVIALALLVVAHVNGARLPRSKGSKGDTPGKTGKGAGSAGKMSKGKSATVGKGKKGMGDGDPCAGSSGGMGKDMGMGKMGAMGGKGGVPTCPPTAVPTPEECGLWCMECEYGIPDDDASMSCCDGLQCAPNGKCVFADMDEDQCDDDSGSASTP